MKYEPADPIFTSLKKTLGLRNRKLPYATNMPVKILLKKRGCSSENWKTALDFSNFQDNRRQK
jgi:hypothetical protein